MYIWYDNGLEKKLNLTDLTTVENHGIVQLDTNTLKCVSICFCPYFWWLSCSTILSYIFIHLSRGKAPNFEILWDLPGPTTVPLQSPRPWLPQLDPRCSYWKGQVHLVWRDHTAGILRMAGWQRSWAWYGLVIDDIHGWFGYLLFGGWAYPCEKKHIVIS